MYETILVQESAIEYTPDAGYLCVICELPFICNEEILYVENNISENEKFLVTDINLLSDNTLKVDLDSNDHVILKSQTALDNYLFQKIIGDFKTFKAHNIGDDKLKIVLKDNKLTSFDLYRNDHSGNLTFSISLFEEKGTYYLIIFEPEMPWKKDEITSFIFQNNQIICYFKNGSTFSSHIIGVPYVMDMIDHIFNLISQ